MAHYSMCILVVGFALSSGGCASIDNLGTGTFGPMAQPCGLVYGGVRSDLITFGAYPIGLPYWIMFDAVGDTITLPYILARQTFEWAMSHRPKSQPVIEEDR